MHLLDDQRVEAAILFASRVCSAPGVYREQVSFVGHASMSAIVRYVQATVPIPIHIWDVSFEARRVGSRLERYGDRIEISLHASQDHNWKRFCTVKELVHILIDREGDFSPYGEHRLTDLLDKGLIGLASGVNPTQAPTQSELAAEIAAIEILYPAQQILEDLEAQKATDPTARPNNLRIALERQMPDFYASTALHPDFRGYLLKAMEQCEERRNSGK